MDVDQQDILVGTSVSSTSARGSVSQTSDTKVSEIQKEIDGFNNISRAQQLRIQNSRVGKKNNRSCGNGCVLRKEIQEKIVL